MACVTGGLQSEYERVPVRQVDTGAPPLMRAGWPAIDGLNESEGLRAAPEVGLLLYRDSSHKYVSWRYTPRTHTDGVVYVI